MREREHRQNSLMTRMNHQFSDRNFYCIFARQNSDDALLCHYCLHQDIQYLVQYKFGSQLSMQSFELMGRLKIGSKSIGLDLFAYKARTIRYIPFFLLGLYVLVLVGDTEWASAAEQAEKRTKSNGDRIINSSLLLLFCRMTSWLSLSHSFMPLV